MSSLVLDPPISKSAKKPKAFKMDDFPTYVPSYSISDLSFVSEYLRVLFNRVPPIPPVPTSPDALLTISHAKPLHFIASSRMKINHSFPDCGPEFDRLETIREVALDTVSNW